MSISNITHHLSPNCGIIFHLIIIDQYFCHQLFHWVKSSPLLRCSQFRNLVMNVLNAIAVIYPRHITLYLYHSVIHYIDQFPLNAVVTGPYIVVSHDKLQAQTGHSRHDLIFGCRYSKETKKETQKDQKETTSVI